MIQLHSEICKRFYDKKYSPTPKTHILSEEELNELVNYSCIFLNVTFEQVMKFTNCRFNTSLRQQIMTAIRTAYIAPRTTLNGIILAFGRKDHTMVTHNIASWGKVMDTEPKQREMTKQLIEELKKLKY